MEITSSDYTITKKNLTMAPLEFYTTYNLLIHTKDLNGLTGKEYLSGINYSLNKTDFTIIAPQDSQLKIETPCTLDDYLNVSYSVI